MDREPLTPSEVVLENAEVFMKWRGLTQEDLADRMTWIGMGFKKKGGGRTRWHRRTIGQMLNGERRLDVDELFALAVALETTVGALLSPISGGGLDLGSRYGIGDLDPIGSQDFRLLLTEPEEKEPRPRLVIEAWPIGRDPEGVPKWVDQKALFNEMLSAAVEEFKANHPEVAADTPRREIMGLMAKEWEASRHTD